MPPIQRPAKCGRVGTSHLVWGQEVVYHSMVAEAGTSDRVFRPYPWSAADMLGHALRDRIPDGLERGTV